MIQKTRIIFILDRSGSMRSIQDETIGGFNAFIQGQRELPGEASVTLIQFDNEYQVVHWAVDIKEFPELTSETFVPRGMTALYDAIGRAIQSHRGTDEHMKTIVAILTDGDENSSKEYTHESVKALITQVQDELGWEVLFIGANIDVKQYTSMLGLKAGNATSFDYTSKGTLEAMGSLNMAATSVRGFTQYYNDGTEIDADNLCMDKIYTTVKNQ